MQRIKGFTLIELLVVISIIALLVGILLPALGAARRTAISVKCLSNHRQIAIGIVGYQNDNKDHFPNKTVRAFFPNGRFKAELHWTQSWLGTGAPNPNAGEYHSVGADARPLNPYVGGPYDEFDDEVPVAVCPADEQQEDSSLFYDWGTSYRANTGAGKTLTINNVSNERPGRLATDVINPSITIAMFESHALEVADKNVTIDLNYSNWDRMFWHSGLGDFRFNTSFCDGHAAMITYKQGEWVTDEYKFNYNDFPRQPEKSEYE